MNTPHTMPASPPVECPPRERATAVTALVVALVLALVLCVLAWLSGAQSAGDITGSATLAGVTPGAGGGGGTGTTGDGPGAGTTGTGRGRDGAGETPPAGMPDGGAAERTPDTLHDAPATAPVEPPRIGFTVPDEPTQPITPPATPPPSGVIDGNGAPGVSGTGSGGTGTEFLGARTEAIRVAFVIDKSGSMVDLRLAHTKLELRRAIEKLPSSGAFLVVFFDSTATPMPPGKLVAATARNKRDGIEWVRDQTAGGGTDPADALEIALQEPRPDAIFLMTDGQFQSEPVFAVINRLNADRKVAINTIGFHTRDAEATLKRIAAENRGDYTYVPPPNVPANP